MSGSASFFFPVVINKQRRVPSLHLSQRGLHFFLKFRHCTLRVPKAAKREAIERKGYFPSAVSNELKTSCLPVLPRQTLGVVQFVLGLAVSVSLCHDFEG